MGMGGIGIWQLLIILLIVVLLFGTKRLKSIGSDLGSAIKGFRSAMGNPDKANEDEGEDSKRLDGAKSEQGSDPAEGAAVEQGSKPTEKT